MKITNKYGLPIPFVDAVKNDSYTRGESDYSVSDIVSPPRLVILSRRYDEELSQDAVDRLWALFGQATHAILERSGAMSHPGVICEKRYYAKVEGKVVSGQIDLLDNGILSDYKTTSAWTIVYGSRGEEWETRMNLYKYLAEENGDKVDALRIVAILRDWSESRVGGKYPPAPVVVIALPVWWPGEAHEYLKERVSALSQAEELSDDDLPECTPDECWERYDKKSGTTRWMRCERYCPAASVCGQWKKFNEEAE